VVCYVGTWATYRTPEEGKFDLESIDASLCTHLIYGFAGLDNLTFVMKPLDPWLDLHEENNGGGRDWYREFNKLKRKYPHLKVLLAVGGWNEGSKKYSEMVAESKNRETFVQSALDLVRKYSFDGLDLDWEFPGDRGGKPEDKRHFTILVQELRQQFDKYGLMLTAAFGPAKSTIDKGYELKELSRMLDHVHIMCYDYHGAWEKQTSHNAPLFSPPGEGSVESSVNLFMSHGVPAYKIVLGLPFYGRTFLLSEPDTVIGSGINEMAQDKGFQGPFTKEDGFLGYNEICRTLMSDRGDWKIYWDKAAKVPFMRNGAKWVAFDNPDSIHEKVSFLLAKGLKGAMIWSIDTDDFRGACGVKNPLLKTINYALAQDESNNEVDTNDDSTAAGTRVYPTAVLSSTLLTFMTMLILTIFSD